MLDAVGRSLFQGVAGCASAGRTCVCHAAVGLSSCLRLTCIPSPLLLLQAPAWTAPELQVAASVAAALTHASAISLSLCCWSLGAALRLLPHTAAELLCGKRWAQQAPSVITGFAESLQLRGALSLGSLPADEGRLLMQTCFLSKGLLSWEAVS